MAGPGISIRRASRLALCLALGAAANRVNDDSGLLEELHGVSASDPWSNVLTKMQENPVQVYQTLKYVVDGTRGSIEYFNKKPPAVADGMSVIQVNMWSAVKTFSDIVDPAFSQSQQFKDAKVAWDKGFTESIPAAQEAADEFERDGNLTAFAEIVDVAVNTSQDVATIAFPTLKTQFEAYGTLMRGASSAWVHYLEGNTELAIESVWVAFNSSIVVMVGQERAAQPEFQKTMQDLDDVVTALISNLINIKKTKTESKICYVKQKNRRSIPPSVCHNDHDWDWDQRKTCHPKVDNGADCGHACLPTGIRCSTFCPAHKPYCCRSGESNQAPECNSATYVNHSYTNGTAEDYFQCVAPLLESLVQEQAVEEVEAKVAEVRKLDEVDVAEGLVARRAASLVQAAGREVTKLDSSLGWKCWVMFWMRSCRTSEDDKVVDDRSRWGTHPAQCDQSTLYKHMIDGQCYPDCDPGYTVVKDGEKVTSECEQSCQSPFGKGGNLGAFEPLIYPVCANTSTHINEANLDITSLAVNTVTTVSAAITALTTKQMNAGILVKTIDAFGKLGAEFARPQCGW